MKAVYVHVPFCRDICAYCDFTRCRYHAGLADQWLIAVKRELQEKLAQVSVETVYIGGGTPSALNSRQLEQLLKLLAPYTTQVQEYTVEANVESLDEDNMKLLKRYFTGCANSAARPSVLHRAKAYKRRGGGADSAAAPVWYS